MGFKPEKLMEVALKKRKAAMVLKNCRVVNVFSGEIEEGDIALEEGHIVGVGRFDSIEEIDLEGRIVCPGFIDAHVHIESAMVTPRIFASVVAARGTTSVIADPHEIANVLGRRGIEYMARASRDLPLVVHIMVPSCVPATSFETAGAVIDAEDIKALLQQEGMLGLGEMMNYPGILAGAPDVMAKITAAGERIIDGHGAGLSGDSLGAYRLAGISTDHECVSAEEAIERLRLGMYVAIREGTAAKNLESLLPAVNRDNWWHFMFCTDDRHLEDIMTEGHIDHCIRKAIGLGLDPMTAVRMATINPARCYNLKDQGAIAPGYRGDLVVVDGLESFNVEEVFVLGRSIAKKGRMLEEPGVAPHPAPAGSSINIAPLGLGDFEIRGKDLRAPVIGVLPGSIETSFEYHEMDEKNGVLVPPPGGDILKIAVVERHRATGNVSAAFIRGLGLKCGAIASSVAHDSHNIIVVGDDDLLMARAVSALNECGGGYCIADGRKGDVLRLPLPVAGLMTDRPAAEVRKVLETLLERAREMGVHQEIDPFITLSFMALPVIPSLKITDKGLFDVSSFKFVDW
ncbi:MAG: adenine deaminase [Clostridia bacterium]|jgi:adenine deaminase